MLAMDANRNTTKAAYLSRAIERGRDGRGTDSIGVVSHTQAEIHSDYNIGRREDPQMCYSRLL